MKRISFLLILTAVLFVVVTCGDDNPVQPQDTPDEHLFYIAPMAGNMVRVFSVEREMFIDSMIIDSVGTADTMRLHVIGDDSLLAVSLKTKTFIYDLSERQIISTFEAYKPTFSRNSQYYYSMGSVKTFPGHVELFHQPGGSVEGKFCNRSEVVSFVYFPNSDTANLVIYNVLGHSSGYSIKKIGNYVLHLHLMLCSPFPSNSLNKTFLSIGCQYSATDFFSDTVRILRWDGFGSGATHIISPDERFSFYTDVGQKVWGFVPTGYLYVYDAADEDSLAAIPFQGLNMADLLVISSDGKYLLVRERYEYMFGENRIFNVIDIHNLAVVGAYDCGFMLGSISSKYCAANGLSY